MRRQIQLLSKLILFTFLTSSYSVFGCSAFLMQRDNYSVIGFNENWKSSPGLVVINKREVVKRSLSWNYLISADKPSEPILEWTSKYGSVCFNMLGLDLPCYGINEKGLFVVELYLDRTYSLQDKMRPKMFWAQWIQYQLDNYATINEVIENLKNTPVIDWWPGSPGSHFFISDREGNTAAIELIEGVFQVSSGKTMPVKVLCNLPYQQELKSMLKFKESGGENSFTTARDNRFPKAASMMNNYNNMGNTPVNYAWDILDSIKPGVWQLVVDLKSNVLYFRTDQGKAIKSINISECDFSKGTAIKFIDINSNLKGDVTDHLSVLTTEINDEYVIKGFPIAYDCKDKEFFNSVGYAKLRSNLHDYAKDKINAR
jgi:penicillin V acylase-like amidase (Ntn superfamily)